ncbi:hypothetical protein [Solicola sp. PLA-1-18]|uniref:hypothetical protein n=1 Tax=Solicola sp. PLA-1-18 TaxID=3380532 RepID=UPI003B7BD525
MTAQAEPVLQDDWFARRRHPGSGAAVAALAMGALWFSLWPVGAGLAVLPDVAVVALWAGLLPLSGFVSLFALAADPHRDPWRWVVVVAARAWAVLLSSAFVLFVRHGPGDPTSDAEIAWAARPAWMFWTEWGVTAGIILLVALAAGLTVKRLPLHSPRHLAVAQPPPRRPGGA